MESASICKPNLRVFTVLSVLILWGVATVCYVYVKLRPNHITGTRPVNSPLKNSQEGESEGRKASRPTAAQIGELHEKLKTANSVDGKNAAAIDLIMTLENYPELCTDEMRKDIIDTLPVAIYPAGILMYFTSTHDVASIERLVDIFPDISDPATRKATAQSAYIIDGKKTGALVAARANTDARYAEFLEYIKAIGYGRDK